MLACVKSESKLGKTKGKMEAKNENQTLQGPGRIGGRREKPGKPGKPNQKKLERPQLLSQLLPRGNTSKNACQCE